MLILTTVEAERFWSKVNKTDGCWLWTGCRTTAGYGMVRIRQIVYYVHRLSLEWHSGQSLPSSTLACHRCDTPNCLNPEHLFAGTHADNSRDSVQKGRHASSREYDKPYGERAGAAKLTCVQVSEIRREYLSGETSQRKLGAKYGVKHSTIGQILRGSSWPMHLPGFSRASAK